MSAKNCKYNIRGYCYYSELSSKKHIAEVGSRCMAESESDCVKYENGKKVKPQGEKGEVK